MPITTLSFDIIGNGIDQLRHISTRIEMALNINLLQPHSHKCCIRQTKEYFTSRFYHPPPSSSIHSDNCLLQTSFQSHNYNVFQ